MGAIIEPMFIWQRSQGNLQREIFLCDRFVCSRLFKFIKGKAYIDVICCTPFCLEALCAFEFFAELFDNILSDIVILRNICSDGYQCAK
jgi:hypothetical protein